MANGAPSPVLELRPCWYCTGYGGMRAAGTAAWCVRARQLQTSPEWGCAFWARDPGVDDEPWVPAGWRPLKPLPDGALVVERIGDSAGHDLQRLSEPWNVPRIHLDEQLAAQQ